ncbi:MAG: T9SS type A sorting domain-containing protein [Bacteroidetes bacterium]|nr:T9SS type A sorting domain-containing protein [Bacteroidota bacterium]
MKKYNTILWICFVIGSNLVSGQYFFEHPEGTYRQVSVTDQSKQDYTYAWAGGMNSCQFGEIDINLDGIMDLIVFDRHGDRLMTFINGGEPNNIDYAYAPEFVQAFPDLYDWVILRDYNNDGLQDIFTYAREYPGIIVYKNVSTTELEFKLEVYPFLTSLQGGGPVNILTTDVDYPGIEDIDGDGDLDILTFWGLGSFVEYHQNQSMELYGIPDSLDYVEVTQCWGRFAESDESNVIYLDTCNFNNSSRSKALNSLRNRHTGSTFLLIDLDADNDKDLVLGDVDYPNPIQLINGGDINEAFMISQDPAFPSYDKPVNLFSMPAATYMDIDNDAKKDLLFSPFDPSLVTSENYRSSWLYSNSGENNAPVFHFEQNNFLQERMIDVGSGAYPVLADYDGDGLQDLFIANFGYYMYSYYEPGMFLHSVYYSAIALFRNAGTISSPKFSQVTHNFAGLQKLHMTGIYPAFGDLDGDNDVDMLIGHEDGTLMYLENIAGPGAEMDFADPVPDYQGIDVGVYSTPQLFDLNGDGLSDLIIGEEAGNLNYYENTGNAANPQFILVTDSLGKVNVTDPNLSYTGYSTPCFFKNPNQETELIVGSESGELYYFKNIENNLTGAFNENDSLYLLLDNEPVTFSNGIRTAVAIAELNQDGFYEMIVGNYAGGVNYYAGIPSPVSGIHSRYRASTMVNVWPNPAKNILYVMVNADQGASCYLEICDLTGRKLWHQEGLTNTRKEINISDLDPGVYLLTVRFGNKAAGIQERFIKVQ